MCKHLGLHALRLAKRSEARFEIVQYLRRERKESERSRCLHTIPQQLNEKNRELRLSIEKTKNENTKRSEEINRLSNMLSALEMFSRGDQIYSSQFLNAYVVDDVLGIGGGGCVYRAVNKFNKGTYAVKRIAVTPSKQLFDKVDQAIEKAIRGEVHAMIKLSHPGIVSYHSTWIEEPPEEWQYEADSDMLDRLEENGKIIQSSDSMLCNYTLTSWLRDNTTAESRNLTKMKAWFKQIVSAVDYMHEKNLIHRDLKPCNILFLEEDHLQICDMGIVTDRVFENGVEITTTQTGLGTREYMSPEQTNNSNLDEQRRFNNYTPGVEITVTRTMVGTEAYMSPEQQSWLSRFYAKSDVFTLGLILAEMCVVMTKEKKNEIFDNYRAGIPNNDIFEDVETAKFVEKLTDTDRNKRPSCSQLVDDTFFAVVRTVWI